MTISTYVGQFVLKPRMLEVDVSRTFVVPDNVYSIAFILQAPGGNAFAGVINTYSQRLGGGAGGNWIGNLEVVPGETLELVIGDKTSVARAGVDLSVVYRGGHAREVYGGVTMSGAGDGGFPNGSGGGRMGTAGASLAGGCAVTVSNGVGLATRPLFTPSAGGGMSHGDQMYGAGRFGGGVLGSGGRTSTPWGYGGDTSSATAVLPPGPGKIILTWFEPSPRVQ